MLHKIYEVIYYDLILNLFTNSNKVLFFVDARFFLQWNWNSVWSLFTCNCCNSWLMFFFCIICKNSIMNLGRFYQLLLQSHVWDWKVLLHKIFFFVILKMIYFANLPTCTPSNIIHWFTNNICKYIMKMLLRRKHSKIITHHLKVVCRRVWQMANIVVISFQNGKTLTCGFFMHQKVRKWLWCLMVACFEVYRKR